MWLKPNKIRLDLKKIKMHLYSSLFNSSNADGFCVREGKGARDSKFQEQAYFLSSVDTGRKRW